MPNPENNSQNKPQKSTLRSLFDVIVGGAAAGAAEVSADHPLWVLKTRYQDASIPKNQKFTLDPRILYRGYFPNMFSMAPITAMQVAVAQGLRSLFHTNKSPSEMQEAAYAAAGGAAAAVIAGPTEFLMSQQTKERGFFGTFLHNVRQQGWRGLVPGMAGTAVRDAKFTMGYAYLSPKLKEAFQEHMSEGAATIAAGACAGLPVAVLSQPWDTIKTRQQTGPKPTTPMWELAKKIVAEEGVNGLYKGSGWRMGRVGAAVMIMSEVNERVKNWLKT